MSAIKVNDIIMYNIFKGKFPMEIILYINKIIYKDYLYKKFIKGQFLLYNSTKLQNYLKWNKNLIN